MALDPGTVKRYARFRTSDYEHDPGQSDLRSRHRKFGGSRVIKGKNCQGLEDSVPRPWPPKGEPNVLTLIHDRRSGAMASAERSAASSDAGSWRIAIRGALTRLFHRACSPAAGRDDSGANHTTRRAFGVISELPRFPARICPHAGHATSYNSQRNATPSRGSQRRTQTRRPPVYTIAAHSINGNREGLRPTSRLHVRRDRTSGRLICFRTTSRFPGSESPTTPTTDLAAEASGYRRKLNPRSPTSRSFLYYVPAAATAAPAERRIGSREKFKGTFDMAETRCAKNQIFCQPDARRCDHRPASYTTRPEACRKGTL